MWRFLREQHKFMWKCNLSVDACLEPQYVCHFFSFVFLFSFFKGAREWHLRQHDVEIAHDTYHTYETNVFTANTMRKRLLGKWKRWRKRISLKKEGKKIDCGSHMSTADSEANRFESLPQRRLAWPQTKPWTRTYLCSASKSLPSTRHECTHPMHFICGADPCYLNSLINLIASSIRLQTQRHQIVHRLLTLHRIVHWTKEKSIRD